jgi:serine/threonine protein kinase
VNKKDQSEIKKEISILYDKIDPRNRTITIKDIKHTEECIKIFDKFKKLEDNFKIFWYIKTLIKENDVYSFEMFSKNYSSIIELDRNDYTLLNHHYKEDFRNKYKTIKRIGYGNCTEVYKGEEKETKELRAIKIIKLDAIRMELLKENTEEEADKLFDDYINKLKNEIKFMEICGENNENSVKYYESYETEDEFVIIMELCDKSLTQLKKDKKFISKEIYEILDQLNKTFKIMNANKIVQRDLKPDNILIKNGKNNKLIIKLCDYGVSKAENFTKLRTHTGTKEYMAPEVIEIKEGNDYNIYNDKCDLWSMGIIIYELFFEESPYKGANEHVILQNII